MTMLKRSLAGLGAALLLSASTAAVQATELVIYHGWSSPAEVAALNVLKSGLEAKGHSWTDLAIPHNTGANVSLVNLITGGNPPNVFMEANPAIYRDLKGMGMGQSLDEYFAANGVTEHLPTSVINSITVDGEIVKIPTAIHIDGMIYYNKEAAAKAGVVPEEWTDLDDMFADFDKIAAAGIIPIAIGGQEWQIGYLTHALAASISPTLYQGIYGTDPDPAVLDSPDMRQLVDRIRQFQQAADAGSVNRDWNVTTNMVITGQALMQLHGDWMKGEWRAAGKTAGTDFGCINIPGTRGLSVTVDAWGILGGVSEELKQAELDFAGVVTDPGIQANFAAAKGSTPVRLDAPKDQLDACSEVVLEALDNPDIQHQNPHNTVDADWQTSIWQTMNSFWADPSMTTDQAIEQLKEHYDTILG
jgi:glucose/mannose transport system substrate-binding protein